MSPRLFCALAVQATRLPTSCPNDTRRQDAMQFRASLLALACLLLLATGAHAIRSRDSVPAKGMRSIGAWADWKGAQEATRFSNACSCCLCMVEMRAAHLRPNQQMEQFEGIYCIFSKGFPSGLQVPMRQHPAVLGQLLICCANSVLHGMHSLMCALLGPHATCLKALPAASLS